MSWWLDLVAQVYKVLVPARGGTGNPFGNNAVLFRGINMTGDPLVLGTLVELDANFDTRVQATTTADNITVLGVVVGRYDDDGFTYHEADAADGDDVAIMVQGVCSVNIGAAVVSGEYAFAHATDGTAYSDGTIGAGAFGIFLQTTTTGPAQLYLYGSMVMGVGGGGGGTLEVKEVDGTPDVTPVSLIIVPNGRLTDNGGGSVTLGPQTILGGFDVIVFSPGTGIYIDVQMKYAGSFTNWEVFNDGAGSIQFDLWNDTYANFPPTVGDTITASDKPKTTAAIKAQGTCTGWTVAFNSGDIIRINVDSTSGLNRSVLSLRTTRV